MATKKINKFFAKSAQLRLYKFLTVLSAIIGLIIFATLYVRNIEGRLFHAMREPATILILLFPFLPAIILSYLSNRVQIELTEVIEKNEK